LVGFIPNKVTSNPSRIMVRELKIVGSIVSFGVDFPGYFNYIEEN
jgi:hypothetical protein